MNSIWAHRYESESSNSISHNTLPITGGYLTSFQRSLLESKVKEDISPKYRQRLQIMLLADDGESQAEIARTLGCSPVTVRHWTLIARSGEAHNWQDNTIGRPKDINNQYLERLKELVKQSPRSVKIPNREFTYLQQRWTAPLLSQHLHTELGIKISGRHINRLLKEVGLSLRSGEKYEQRHLKPVPIRDGIQIQDISGSADPQSFSAWSLGLPKKGELSPHNGTSYPSDFSPRF